MNEVFCITWFCVILLTVAWSQSTSDNLLPEKCAFKTQHIANEYRKWTFCIQHTSNWTFYTNNLQCANEDDVISIYDFQLYENDSTCPLDLSGFQSLSIYNATCMQGENKLLAKNLAKSIIKSFSGKRKSELSNITSIESDLKILSNASHRLVVNHDCYGRNTENFYFDICANTTRLEMTKIEIQLSSDKFLKNQMNVSMCSCSIASTSNLTVIALDVRLHHSNILKLSPGESLLHPNELYWSKDGNLVQSSTNLNITLSGLQTSFPESMWLKVTGTNMTVMCQPVSVSHREDVEDAKIDMILIIIIAAVSSVAIILVIILICCICKYRRQKQRLEMCNSPTTTPLVPGKVHKEEIVYSEPGKPVPSISNESNYIELENTYEEPTDPNNAKTDQWDPSAEESQYNHLREKSDLLPSNIYDTTTKSEYSSFRRNAAGHHVIDNDYDI